MPTPTPAPAPQCEALNRRAEDIEFLAYEGGAAFGLAYPSAMFCLEQAFLEVDGKTKQIDEGVGFKWPVRGVSGTSIGAIFAYLTTLGYSAEEVTELAVRDGLFSKVFDEKFEYGRVMAAATGEGRHGKKTKLGWYGDHRVHRKDPWCLNEELGGEKGKVKGATKAQGEGKVLSAANALGPEVKELLNEGGLITPISLLIEPMLKLVGLPEDPGSVKKELSKFILEVLVDAILAIAGEPGEQLSRISLKRISDEINDSINTKLSERFWMIEEALGGTPVARVAGHLPLIAIFLLIVRIDLWIPSWRNKRKRGRKHDFLNKGKLNEIQWAEVEAWVDDQKDDGVNRTRSPFWYHMKLLFLAFWKNAMNEQVIIKHWRKLVPMTAKLGKVLTGDQEKADEFRETLILELIKFGWSIIHSPFTRLAWKSISDEGGLLNGQKVRDLLVYTGFNKCAVVPSDDKPGGWRLVRRPESLVKTLNRLVGHGKAVDAQAFSTKYGGVIGAPQHWKLSGQVRDPDRFRKIDHDLFYALDCAQVALEQLVTDGELQDDRHEIQKKWKTITSSMASLSAFVSLYLNPPLISKTPKNPQTISVPDQFRAIEEDLTFERLHDALGIDLVCTSANYTTSSACYWRRSLTPDFPVIEAVRTAGAFPALFKPTAISYEPADDEKGFGSGQDQTIIAEGPQRGDEISRDTKDQMSVRNYTVRQWFYETHYRGYFNDAGVFNNLPIHAFNGMLPADAKLPEGAIDPAEFHLPAQSLQKQLNPAVLGIELSNENLSRYLTDDKIYRPPSNPFRKGYTERKGLKTTLNNKHRSFGGLLGGILNALYAMSGKFRRLDRETDRAVLQVIHGNIAMWDMIPNMNAIRDCYYFNIRRASHALGLGEKTSDWVAGRTHELVGQDEIDKKQWDYQADQRLKMSGLDRVI